MGIFHQQNFFLLWTNVISNVYKFPFLPLKKQSTSTFDKNSCQEIHTQKKKQWVTIVVSQTQEAVVLWSVMQTIRQRIPYKQEFSTHHLQDFCRLHTLFVILCHTVWWKTVTSYQKTCIANPLKYRAVPNALPFTNYAYCCLQCVFAGFVWCS
jgi:hypothetical protein